MSTWIRLGLFLALLVMGMVFVLWPQHEAPAPLTADPAPVVKHREPHTPPGTLGRSATIDDIIGAWFYRADDPPSILNIAFYRDGTYQQNVAVIFVQTGSWKLQGNHLVIEDPLLYVDGRWASHGKVTWEIVNSTRHPGRPTIYGSTTPDAEDFQEFEKR